MAFAVKYRADFDTQKSGVTYRADIEFDDYAGAIIDVSEDNGPFPALAPEPVHIKTRGSKDTLENLIFGTEVEVTFITDKDNLSTFADLFTSKYEEVRLQLYRESSLIFIGYMKPDNITRNFLGKTYEITLSFTDGLADLKKFDFADSNGLPYTDRVSILTVLKRALSVLDIEIDFHIQLNTYEADLGAADECSFEVVTVNCARWEKIESGIRKPANCYEVIQDVLRPFYCTMRQADGLWTVINYQEYDSYVYLFDWDTLAETSRTASDLEIDINAYDFTQAGTLSLIEPKKTISVTFQNRTAGDNELVNGTFDSDISGWTSSGFDVVAWNSLRGGVLKTFADDDTVGYIQTTFPNTAETTNDLIYVFLDAWAEFTLDGNGPNDQRAYFYIQLIYPSGRSETTEQMVTVADFVSYGPFIFSGNETGTYTVRVYAASGDASNLTNISFFFDNIRVFASAENDPVTLDGILTLRNTTDGVGSVEDVVLFGDSGQNSDLGALVIGTTLTSSWNRYGKTDELQLQQLYAIQILNNYQRYKNYIKTKIWDVTDALAFKNVLTFDSKQYIFVNYDKSLRTGRIGCELAELITTDLTYSASFSQPLSTGGVDTGGSSSGNVNNPGGVTNITNISNTYVNVAAENPIYLVKLQYEGSISSGSPVDVIPAPGAGKAIQVLDVIVLGNTTSPTEPDAYLRYADSTENICVIPMSATAALYYEIKPSAYDLKLNKAIQLATDDFVTSGTGGMQFQIYYRLIEWIGFEEL